MVGDSIWHKHSGTKNHRYWNEFPKLKTMESFSEMNINQDEEKQNMM